MELDGHIDVVEMNETGESRLVVRLTNKDGQCVAVYEDIPATVVIERER